MYLYVTFSGSFNKNIGLLSKLMLFGNVTSVVRFKFDKYFFGGVSLISFDNASILS